MIGDIWLTNTKCVTVVVVFLKLTVFLCLQPGCSAGGCVRLSPTSRVCP
jgi:hypothetical protein